jgi:hypothetical protein
MTELEYIAYAKEIADDVWEESDHDEDTARDWINERVDGVEHVIYYSKAWDLVYKMRGSEYYDTAHNDLTDTEGDKIGKNETIDHVMCRLAYCILETIASERLEEIISEQD